MDHQKLSERYQLTLPSGSIIKNINGRDKAIIQQTGTFPFAVVQCAKCRRRHHPGVDDGACPSAAAQSSKSSYDDGRRGA